MSEMSMFQNEFGKTRLKYVAELNFQSSECPYSTEILSEVCPKLQICLKALIWMFSDANVHVFVFLNCFTVRILQTDLKHFKSVYKQVWLGSSSFWHFLVSGQF